MSKLSKIDLHFAEPASAPLHEAPVLDYENPTATHKRKRNWSNAAYPFSLAILCTIVGLLSPVQAGGSDGESLAALGLLLASAWYITCRIARDKNVGPAWRLPMTAVANRLFTGHGIGCPRSAVLRERDHLLACL